MGLFGSSLRMLDLMPGSHGPAPFQQATVNLLAYCTSAPWAPAWTGVGPCEGLRFLCKGSGLNGAEQHEVAASAASSPIRQQGRRHIRGACCA